MIFKGEVVPLLWPLVVVIALFVVTVLACDGSFGSCLVRAERNGA